MLAMLALYSVQASAFDVQFPRPGSDVYDTLSTFPLGAGGGGVLDLAGSAVTDKYLTGLASVDSVRLQFSMDDVTNAACAVGTLDFRVELNGVTVGRFSWLGGMGVGAIPFDEVYQFAPVTGGGPAGDGYKIRLVSLDTVCAGGGAYNYFPGGTLSLSGVAAGGVDADGDGVDVAVDCDDGDPTIGAASAHGDDLDGDGHALLGGPTTVTCPGLGLSTLLDDCDDANAAISPSAPEGWCDDEDANCNGIEEDARFAGVSYATVADAIAAAPDLETIEVCHGATGWPNAVTRPMSFLAAGPDTELTDTKLAPLADGTLVFTGFRIHDSNHRDALNGRPVGGGLYVTGEGDVELSGCTVQGLPIVDRGGAIGHEGTGTLSLLDTIVLGGGAFDLGGGIYATGPLVLSGTTTVSGGSARLGGGIWSSASITLNDTASVHTNTANDDGGGIWTTGDLFAPGGILTDNIAASGEGGGIWFGGATADASGLQIDVNYADLAGGAVSLEGAGTWTGGTAADNYTAYLGGAFWVEGTWTVADVVLDGNYAEVAGGGFATAEADLTLTDVRSAGDAADSGSHGVDMLGGSLTATRVAWSGPGERVGLWIHGGTATLDGCTVEAFDLGLFLEMEPFQLSSIASTWLDNGEDVYGSAAAGDYGYTSIDGTFSCDPAGCID